MEYVAQLRQGNDGGPAIASLLVVIARLLYPSTNHCSSLPDHKRIPRCVSNTPPMSFTKEFVPLPVYVIQIHTHCTPLLYNHCPTILHFRSPRD